FFDESSTHALLQLKPATLTLVDEFPEDAYCAPGPGTNVSGQDVSGSSHSNSRGLSMTDPTVNTKMALHTVNDMWSGSLFRDDSVTANTDDPVPVKEKLPFTIVKDDHKRQEDVGICKGTSLAFTIYSDGDNQKKCVPQSSESLALVKDDTSTKAKCLATQEELYPENQNENLPPMGYQQEKEVRTLAGILQPATNVPFIPLEEQLKEEEEQDEEAASDDKEINDDDDEYVILQNRPSMADLTLKMPFSSEAFAKNAKIVSTPAAWVLEEAPKVTITDNGSVTAFKVADHFPLVNEVQEKDDPEEKDSGELMPPPDKIWPSTTLEYKPKGEFSPIMETSREYISSSSSSGNSATSTMLGASLPSSLTHCAGLSASQTSRSRHCSNAQAEGGLEQVTGSQTGDFTKSGYLADKSRGESLADSRPSAAPYQSNALGDEEFMFNPVEAAAAMLEMEKLPSSAPPTGTKETLKDSNATEVKEAPSINFPDKINPFDNALIGQLLSNLNENVENRGGFIQMSGKLPLVKPNMQITLGQEFFRVRRLQGEGAYAKVYQATTVDPMNVTVLPSLNDSDEEDENDELQMILKIQKPACLWEFYICHELRRRLKANAASEQVLDSVMRINRGYIYANGSILVNQYHKYGTLLDMVNGFKSNGRGVPEDIAMYYMIEVLSIVEHLHNCQIIHADIKPDNFVVRDMPNISVTAKSPDEMFQFSPCSLKLIDFGRSIDMKLLPEGTTFTEKVTTEGFTCCEMREGLPWTYQTDLFGIASIAYCLLFGSYMDVKKGPSGKWELKGATIKRYWVEHLWNELFSTLLNVPSCSSLPNLSALKKKFMMCIFEKKLERELTGNIQKLNVILLQKK
ncbi:protein kinase, partial [Halocaridina rubra]